MRQGSLQCRRFLTLFLRDSAEKWEELARYGHAGASMHAFINISVGALAHLKQTSFFVQTSSDIALGELLRELDRREGAPRVSYTRNPRSDHDTWGSWQNVTKNSTHSTLQGTIAAVNAYVASLAGVLVAPTTSAWTGHLVSLMEASDVDFPSDATALRTKLCCNYSVQGEDHGQTRQRLNPRPFPRMDCSRT
jgi:hypothetical protein